MRPTDLSVLTTLRDPRAVTTLRALAIVSVADLASFPAFRHAELLVGLDRNATDGAGLIGQYLREGQRRPGESLGQQPVSALRALTVAEAQRVRDGLGVRTIGEMAGWPPFVEAVAMVTRAARPAFSEPPSAPEALIPTLIGSTHTASRLSSYVKDRVVDVAGQKLVRLQQPDDVPPRTELLALFTRDEITFALGYLALVRQAWVNAGTHLGEIMHSLALAPGESRNIAVVDWMQRQRSSRREDTTASERLDSTFQQTRAINEVVSTTAREHLEGMTQVDATTKTTGAGLTGGLGGGKASGGSASGGVSLGEGAMGALGALVGLAFPLAGTSASGKGAASSLQSGAGGIGASYVHSNGTVQGTLLSETSGEREVLGELVQNISDATVQNSSNVRALMSTVVVEDEQEGRQRSQTRNITNYNHSHALSMQYYEVLQKYLVRTTVAGLTPVLFLPFRPLRFRIGFIQEYWQVLREPVRRAFPARFKEFDRVVKDFDPRNNAFDASGELVIDTVRITRTRSWSSVAKVNFPEADPSVKISFPGFQLDETLTLSLVGSSTYLDYEVLEETEFETSDFGSSDSIPVDANVRCRIDSDFRGEFRSRLKEAIEDANKKLDGDRGFNELGAGNNKKNLKDDVDSGRYELLNPSDGVTLSLDLEFTVRDANGNTEVVTHQHEVTYSYKQLHDEVSAELFSVSGIIGTALGTTADFNPLDTIADIEEHFQLHRYGYTRYLLSVLEKEQVIDILDHLAAEGGGSRVPLTRIVDPSPLAVVENFLVVKLKDLAPNKQDGETMRAACADYVAGLNATRRELGRWDRSETVYLPTAGLFGEAILGRSNASEFLDMRRFFNWQDSPIPNAAPAIVAVDLNQRRGSDVAGGLGPTVIDSTLSQVLPTAYPMPTGLTSALQAVQNGQMFTDMSKTSDFAGILGNLSALASSSAQLAGNLSGDAMAKALDSAVALGSKVASMTETAMRRTPAGAPKSLTEKGAQEMNIERVSATPTPPHVLSDVDKGRIAAGGTDVSPCPSGDSSTPTPAPAPGTGDPDPGDPDPGEGPETPETPAATSLFLPVQLTVPAASVRLDLASAAWGAIPASAKSYVGSTATLLANWVYSIGFDEEGSFDVLSQALKAFLAATPVVGEIVLAVEGIKALVDFVGADEDVAADTATAAAAFATMVMESLQALVFPALRGGEWMSLRIKVDFVDGVPTASLDRWNDPGIPYGFLTAANPSEDGTWWKGEAWSSQMWSSTRVQRRSVQVSASIDPDGDLVVKLTGSAPLQLNWPGVVAAKLTELAGKLAEVLRDTTVARGVAQQLGVTDAQAEIMGRVNAAFATVSGTVVALLGKYFVPHIDFDINVRVEDGGTSGWLVTVTGAHDAFPEYVLSIKGPGDATELLYQGPAGVESSAEGPLALLTGPADLGEPMTPVEEEWIPDWRVSP